MPSAVWAREMGFTIRAVRTAASELQTLSTAFCSCSVDVELLGPVRKLMRLVHVDFAAIRLPLIFTSSMTFSMFCDPEAHSINLCSTSIWRAT
jgi:hypothetical protein